MWIDLIIFYKFYIQENLPNLSLWREKFQRFFYEKKMTKHLQNLRNDVMKELMA